jgi:ATP phosphoribosyltransferase
MVVAVKRGFGYAAAVRQGARLRHRHQVHQYRARALRRKGVHVDLIRLYGSMELAPLLGPCRRDRRSRRHRQDLKANGLVAVEEIMPVSARLIVNQARSRPSAPTCSR